MLSYDMSCTQLQYRDEIAKIKSKFKHILEKMAQNYTIEKIIMSIAYIQ